MPAIDDLDGNELKKVWAAIRKLQTANPNTSGSVERGRLRFYAGSELLIQNGNLTVSGTATIDGRLTGSGTLTWTGPVDFAGTSTLTGTTNLNGPTTIRGTTAITGTTTVTGAMNINGDVDITKTLDITGNTRIMGTTTLSDDLTLTGGGKITAGGISLVPSGGAFGGGQITAASGITIGAPLVVFTGGLGVDGNATFAGTLTNSGMGTTTEASNVRVNAVGKFERVTSASRYKLDTKPTALPDALLDVPMKDWIDSGQKEEDRSTRHRIPGVIAEEVEAAGGDLFVTYDTEGEIQGVAYDRFALARTQVLADRLDRALARIESLEAALAKK